MENEEALPSSMQPLVNYTAQDAVNAKPSPKKPEVCMMRDEASAEIVDEMTNDNSIHWPMNLQIKQEVNKEDECLPKGSGLDHWFESQALSEAVSSVNVDHLDPHNPSIHEILEASRLNKNKDILQLLDEIGSGLGTHYWQEAGSSEFTPQGTYNYSTVGSTDECQHFRSFMEPSSFVMPPLPASCCNLVQPGVSTVWTGQSVVETGRGLTVECLQAGEAFSVENTSQELNDLNDEIRKQEEKKRKRRERNKQCSREFRRKQKVREQLLIRGKAEKEQMLVERHKRIEKTTKILVKIATSTGACEKGRGIINMVSGLINKENIPSTMVLKNNYCNVAHRWVCSHTKTQGF